MIVSFKCKDTEKLFYHKSVKSFRAIERIALRKLKWLGSANSIQDLQTPPGNRLEMLKGDRKGQYSIRINDQFRLCFYFKNGDASEVEIVDYHR